MCNDTCKYCTLWILSFLSQQSSIYHVHLFAVEFDIKNAINALSPTRWKTRKLLCKLRFMDYSFPRPSSLKNESSKHWSFVPWTFRPHYDSYRGLFVPNFCCTDYFRVVDRAKIDQSERYDWERLPNRYTTSRITILTVNNPRACDTWRRCQTR